MEGSSSNNEKAGLKLSLAKDEEIRVACKKAVSTEVAAAHGTFVGNKKQASSILNGGAVESTGNAHIGTVSQAIVAIPAVREAKGKLHDVCCRLYDDGAYDMLANTVETAKQLIGPNATITEIITELENSLNTTNVNDTVELLSDFVTCGSHENILEAAHKAKDLLDSIIERLEHGMHLYESAFPEDS